MTRYPSIQNLWTRDPETHIVQRGQLKREEFKDVQEWEVTEKIDGMNIRVIYNAYGVRFAGRSDKAQLPKNLTKYLEETFPEAIMESVFGELSFSEIILYGEGYGAGINKGGLYFERTDRQEFILFDVTIDGVWQEGADVTRFGAELSIPRTHVYGVFALPFIEDLVFEAPLSPTAEQPRAIEGVVCRSVPLQFNEWNERIMFKLKVKDCARIKLEEANK